jgi:hypothetical protein
MDQPPAFCPVIIIPSSATLLTAVDDKGLIAFGRIHAVISIGPVPLS